MTSSHEMPDAYDKDFWRARTRLLKRAKDISLSELALREVSRSLQRAEQWAAANENPSAAGERRRADRLRSIADLEAQDLALRVRILRLRASELLAEGQTSPAATLTQEADELIQNHLPNLSADALKAQNASTVLVFARASLDENPDGPFAPRLKELIASARRTIQGRATPAKKRLAG